MLTAALSAAILATHPPVVVPPDGGAVVPVPFHPVRKLLPAAATEGGVTVYEFEVPPESAGAPPHVHSREDEYFYVLEGEATLLNGEETIVAPAGTLAALTRGHQHAFWNAGDALLRMLVIVSGDNAFEPFFDALVDEIAWTEPGDGQAFGALVDRVAADHGIEMRPEALPDEALVYYAPPEAKDKEPERR